MADRGSFHLGNTIDPATGKPGADRIVVGSSDLTTHGVIVGMTGSGKTGLGIVLIEEACRRDPRADPRPEGRPDEPQLAFPELEPPTSGRGSTGRGASARSSRRVRRAAGRRCGRRPRSPGPRPGHRSAPGRRRRHDLHARLHRRACRSTSSARCLRPSRHGTTTPSRSREEIDGYVSGLLGLVGIEADPLASREHILLSNLDRARLAGRAGDSTSPTLIGDPDAAGAQARRVRHRRVLPARRTARRSRSSSTACVASPSFAAWGRASRSTSQGLLAGADGKPRRAVVYLAHLSDDERQFVVRWCFSKLVTWMRQPVRHDRPARARLHGRGVRLRAADREAAVEEADPHAAQAGAGRTGRAWCSPRRTRSTSTTRRCRTPARGCRPPADRAGQGPRARGHASAAGGADVAASRDDRRPRQARVPAATPARGRGPEAVHHPLGDVVPARPDDEGAGSDAHRASRARRPRRLPAHPSRPGQRRPPPRPWSSRTTSLRSRPRSPPACPVSYLDPAAAWASRRSAPSQAPRRFRAFLAARVSLRYDDSAAGIDEQEEFEAVYGPLDGGLDLASETQVDYDERDFAASAAFRRGVRPPQAPLGETALLHGRPRRTIQRHLVDRRPLELQRNRRLPARDDA